ncbi:MAG: hypothetical protein U0V70_18140 [Terriglobia bacterium]
MGFRNDVVLRPPFLFALGAVLIVLLLYRFGNIREEWVVKRFLEELKAGEYQKAYQTWGPTGGYTYQDFMADWGGNGYYGKIQEFKIVGSKSEGTGVVIEVEFSHLKRPVFLWVERRSHTLGFSPIEQLR